MLHQRDYILRVIEQLGRILRMIRDRLAGRTTVDEETLSELRRVGQEVGLDLDMARGLTPETVTILVTATGRPDLYRCWLLAELLFLDGLLRRESKQPEAGHSFRLAHSLFRLLPADWAPGAFTPTTSERLKEIGGYLES